MLLSCSKDEVKNTNPASVDPKYEKYYRLLAFWERAEGKVPTYPVLLPRSGYTVTDIRDYIEGTLNLVYTDPGLTWAHYETKIDTFTISLTSGRADETSVFSKYDEIVDSVSVFFYSISEEDKFPYLFDVVNISSNSSVLQFSVYSMMGKEHKDITPFGSNDYWSVFDGEGHCAPMSGETDNASDRLNEVLTDYYTPYGCVVWTNLTSVSVQNMYDYGWDDKNLSDPHEDDFIIDYRTFYAYCDPQTNDCDELVDNGVYCLDPDEMNYYFSSIVEIYNIYSDVIDLHVRRSNFGIWNYYGATSEYHYWLGNVFFGTITDCAENGEFPHFLPPCSC